MTQYLESMLGIVEVFWMFAIIICSMRAMALLTLSSHQCMSHIYAFIGEHQSTRCDLEISLCSLE